ncbi:MAG TPA: cohesin domain-containing protein [Pseudobacteroides sp.]|uniref:cohesin domain-containing protein n=1 Tax=Pseudobacteroides sp. TaxID=1968840 RepID=UPI002F930FA5
MKIKRLIAVLMTTIMLFGSIFVNLSLAAEPVEGLMGEVHLSLDKTTASIGDIITATLHIKGFDVVAGYQANIKYDPQVLQPVYLDETPYDIGSAVEIIIACT